MVDGEEAEVGVVRCLEVAVRVYVQGGGLLGFREVILLFSLRIRFF